MGRIKVLDGGLLTTIQDFGRIGYQRYGVSQSGVMDLFSARVANELVGNLYQEALLETTLKGGELEFLKEGLISITGAENDVSINGKNIELWRSYKVFSGDRLKIGFCKNGLRNYIGFSGGIDTPLVMGSRSTDLKAKIGGINGCKLKKDDEISIFEKNISEEKRLKKEYIPKYSKEIEVRVILGQQQDSFTESGIEKFFNSEYEVSSESDRMGIRLSGEKIEHIKSADILSDGITFGAIQIPGNGQPIIMMADRQTIGGYTKIGNVITVDLPKLAQAVPGSKIKFKEIKLEDAVNLLKEQEEILLSDETYVESGIFNMENFYRVTINGNVYNVEIRE